jgi:site-specific recombinase XerD
MAEKTKDRTEGLFLSEMELTALIQVPTNLRDRCLVKLFAQTDILRRELSDLTIPDIHFELNQINIPGPKARTIECSIELINDLKAHIGTRTDGSLFLSNRDKQISLRQINYILQGIGKRAGIKSPNPKHKHINHRSFAKAS